MVTRKRNEWLDAEESEDDERGYDSEEESKSRMLPSAKRQKREHQSDSEEDNDLHNDEEQDDSDDDEVDDFDEDDDTAAPKNSELAHLEKLAASLPANLKLPSTKLGKPIPLSKPTKDKSGVIYLSRVPPFMKPTVLRSLLTPYGAVGKIFLTPEPAASRTQRLRGGGTRRKLFLDGWVEFLHKRDAKFVADNLNAQTMGGKKRGRWHDEVWNIKYLSGIKWNHLVETIQNENAERAARLRVEISRGKAENKAFLENLEMGKMIQGIEAKKKEKEERGEGVGAGEVVVEKVEGKKVKKPRREFVQHGVTTKGAKKPEPGQDVGRVLNSVM
ncbi:Pre-rRNA-processing protein ESF2 [Paraphoma chrysanthemicola]|uniref:18S rRNA factor 2 n=1 Tax=Paraphoma chrysanthemicola TaxID=798071 RepID=A0A8K0RGF4_9PLEO|nr:Pre-rRNA-processing protein ESF2 [Paraphoma chrysanthemicola]